MAILWNSDNPVSMAYESWIERGQFVKVWLIKDGFSGFL